jgi:hypothetical protein
MVVKPAISTAGRNGQSEPIVKSFAVKTEEELSAQRINENSVEQNKIEISYKSA